MIPCDIVLAYNKNDVCHQVFIAYDRQMLISADIFGIQTTTVKQLLREYEYIRVVTPVVPFTYAQRKKLSDILYSLLDKTITISFKERFNFVKYIFWLYEGTIHHPLFEHASIPRTIEALLDSHLVTSTIINKSIQE